jgi:glycine reductase
MPPERTLTINTYWVQQITFGDKTSLDHGTLTISQDEVLTAILLDSRITSAELELTAPGESTRVTGIKDCIEPRLKVAGPGQTYPGIGDRDVTAVGFGATNRISGMAITLISTVPAFNLASASPESQSGSGRPATNLFDMSGPGANASPYGKLRHVCLILETSPDLHLDDQNWALQTALLRVSDLIAGTTVGESPDEVEVFDTSLHHEGVPGIAYIPCMNSPQHYSDSTEAYGAGIYGVTMQTPPWVLRPAEILDGAICGSYSWQMTNNPVIMNLLRKHAAKQCNFVGVIAIRTRWSSQAEKDLTANQAAKIASDIGAVGAVVTWDSGGNDFMEVARTVQACELVGVKTVLLTGEESSKSGGPALLEPLVEMDAIVSTGVGSNMWFEETSLPAVENVIGPTAVRLNFGPESPLQLIDAFDEVETLQWEDHYGFESRSCYTH